MTLPRNVGGLVTSKECLTPRAQADATAYSLVGSTILKKDAHSALFVVKSGPFTGTPSSVAIDAKLQDSADGSTWADVATSTTNPAVAITQITAINTRRFLEVNLAPLRENVRLVFQVVHGGGTSPTTGLAAEAIVGGLMDTPPTHT